jgi:hypothetical protein
MLAVTEVPPTARFEEPFLRNFMGYLNSCHVAKAQPNPLQMLLFLNSVSPHDRACFVDSILTRPGLD